MRLNESDPQRELVAALCKAKRAFATVAKNSTNPHFKSKYADLAAYIEATEPALNENGLCVIQLPGACADGTLSLTTLLIHEGGGTVDSYMQMPLKQLDPQGYGSALTYARRYAYAAILGLVADDDDGNGATHAKADPKPKAEKAEPKTEANGHTAQAADILNEVSELGEGAAYARSIGMTVDDLTRLKAEAKQAGIDWRMVAFDAKQKGITDVDGMVALLDRPKDPVGTSSGEPEPEATSAKASDISPEVTGSSDPFADALTVCGVKLVCPVGGASKMKRKPDQRTAVAASLRGRSPLSAEMLAKIIAEAVGGKSLDPECGAVYDMALQFVTKADDEQLAELQEKMGVAV